MAVSPAPTANTAEQTPSGSASDVASLATATPTPTQVPEIVETPTVAPTATPLPTSTDTPATETPTSAADERALASMTATALATDAETAWAQQAREVHRINQALVRVGQGYQNGTVSEADAVKAVEQADRDAAGVAPRMGSLAPPPSADAATAADTQRAAATWSATLHALRKAADDRDFFTGVQLVSQMQADSQRLDAALDRLHLPTNG